jgi:hypothetical protein
VTEALERASDLNLAADGVVVLHVWMMIAHKLYSSVRQCKQGMNAQEFIDSAVALWIGKEQQEAGTSGWMLYAVGQTAAMNFGHDGEASTNSRLMIQFNEMQRVAGQCTEDAKVHLDLRLQVSETIRLLSIPLLQQLLFHIVINDRWHVELYAMSVISQLVACHPQAYMELTKTLYSEFTPEKVGGDFVDHLVTFMECRRISCEDVTTGTAARADLQDFIAQICQRLNHRGNTASIRGYVPSTDVREQSRIDLDVLQIDIFMRMEAREAALDYYMNGHNPAFPSDISGTGAIVEFRTVFRLLWDRRLRRRPDTEVLRERISFEWHLNCTTGCTCNRFSAGHGFIQDNTCKVAGIGGEVQSA